MREANARRQKLGDNTRKFVPLAPSNKCKVFLNFVEDYILNDSRTVANIVDRERRHDRLNRRPPIGVGQFFAQEVVPHIPGLLLEQPLPPLPPLTPPVPFDRTYGHLVKGLFQSD
jgi:hypothetical protein